MAAISGIAPLLAAADMAARRLRRAGGLAFAALGLAACVSSGGERAAPSAATISDIAVPQQVASPAEPAAPVAWRQPAAEPMARLVGLDDATLKLLLGMPGLIRREPPAEVWRYTGKNCTLHLFLYRGPTGTYRVLHAEARPLADRGGCLERLIEERSPRPLSS